MLFEKRESEPLSKLTVALGSLVLAGLIYASIRAIPEVVRYLRIRRM